MAEHVRYTEFLVQLFAIVSNGNYCCFLFSFFLILFNYAIQGKLIT